MANQEEVRDVYGYFEQKGNALCYRYEAERVRIEPWGADSLRVRAWKTAEMDQADWALIKPEKEITPEIDVGTIASMEVAAAWRCDSPSHTSADDHRTAADAEHAGQQADDHADNHQHHHAVRRFIQPTRIRPE